MRDDGLFPKVENLEIDLELISFIIKSEEGFILKEIPKMEMNANSIRRKLFAFEREGIIEEIEDQGNLKIIKLKALMLA